MLVVIVLYVVQIGVVLAAQDTGNPSGLLADCPGMNKSIKFSEATKRSITMRAIRPTEGFFSDEIKCKLSKAGAACVAGFLDFKKAKTIVLISGYMDVPYSPLILGISRLYYKSGYNVIVMDVFPILVRTYPISARVTKPLGKLLGEFLAELSRLGLSANRLELVGGSLGAHISSFAGHRYQEITGQKFARLTGLDPAGPCFRNLPPIERFNADSAERVDALHTNIDGFGIADAVAHVDFYANGGEFQPAMTGGFLLPCFQLCSHLRSGFYWISAFRHPDKFLAVRCESVAHARKGNCYQNQDQMETNLLGSRTNFSRPGIYYLPTATVPPYYLGDDGAKQRKLGVNNYLINTAPDDDLLI